MKLQVKTGSWTVRKYPFIPLFVYKLVLNSIKEVDATDIKVLDEQ